MKIIKITLDVMYKGKIYYLDYCGPNMFKQNMEIWEKRIIKRIKGMEMENKKMREIKIKEEMLDYEYVDNNHSWELSVKYNGKNYLLHLYDATPSGPSMDDWEKELEKKLERERCEFNNKIKRIKR